MILGLKRLVMADATQGSAELIALLDAPGDKQATADLLALADLFNELSARGAAERKACLQVMKVFAEYRRSSRRTWS
jgi:hypothetical protein